MRFRLNIDFEVSVMTLGKILIADDEESLREMLVDAFSIANYQAKSVDDGAKALESLQKGGFDLAILDVNMPKLSGFEVLSKLRESGNQIPIVLLTARTDRDDVTQGLKRGADDYVRKPFGLEELLLRVQAILRRHAVVDDYTTVFTCNPVVLNRDTYTVTVFGDPIDLSPTEFRLLELLISNKNRVVRKSEMLSEVWSIDFDTSTNVVDTYISYLRKKIHRDGYEGIKTVRGVGFQMEELT